MGELSRDRTQSLPSSNQTHDDAAGNDPSPLALVEPCLVLALEGDRPLAGGARFSMAGVHEVVIGRGPARRATRQTHDGITTLSIEVPARSLSLRHARIVRAREHWILEDTNSRNGSFMDGHPVQRSAWNERSVVQLGHVFFLLRNAFAPRDVPLTLDALELEHDPEGLRTLVPARARAFERLQRVARAGLPIWLDGEPGSGKELVARGIHAMTGREGAFVPVSCPAVSSGLATTSDTEGGMSHVASICRAADKGSLFLDEIGDLPEPAQTTLLQVLQHSVSPGESADPSKSDVLIISATRLHAATDPTGRSPLRADLLARLSGHVLTVPPLRERLEDMGLVIADALRLAGLDRAASTRITPAAGTALLAYRWPLNIRELKHVLLSSLALSQDGVIHLEHLPEAIAAAVPRAGAIVPAEPAVADNPLSDEARRLRAALLAALREHYGNVAAVARAMHKAPMQIHRWVKRFGIEPKDFRPPRRAHY